MNPLRHSLRPRHALLAAGTLLLWSVALPGLAATRPVDAHQAADPNASVEIVNVAGSVEVSGWDKPEVSVSGTIGPKVERVDVTGSGSHVSVHVVVPNHGSWGDDSDAHLQIRVPAKSSLDISLVSADLKVAGVSGNQHLQTVSGDIIGDVAGTVQVSSVSGDVQLTARNGLPAQVKTVSGDLKLSGAGGDINVTTVSGDAIVTLGTVAHAHFESVSGDLAVSSTLEHDGQFDATSVSGDVKVDFTAMPEGEFDVQSFSGGISNCIGPKPVEEHYGPGSRLNFRNGNGKARVHIDTKSGDVSLCAKK